VRKFERAAAQTQEPDGQENGHRPDVHNQSIRVRSADVNLFRGSI
jgi:hypothetical protein